MHNRSRMAAGNTRVAVLLVSALSLAASPTALSTESEWALVKGDAQIQLYTRPVSGSPYVEVKVTALINASVEGLTRAFGDGNGCSGWRAMCKSSEVLGKVSDTERYVYLVLDLPWPIADRDMVIHSTTEVDRADGTTTVYLEPASARRPPRDYVRAETTGLYRIQAIGDDQVELTYIMHTDLGGDLSADMVNRRVASTTYRDIEQLRELAEH